MSWFEKGLSMSLLVSVNFTQALCRCCENIQAHDVSTFVMIIHQILLQV